MATTSLSSRCPNLMIHLVTVLSHVLERPMAHKVLLFASWSFATKVCAAVAITVEFVVRPTL